MVKFNTDNLKSLINLAPDYFASYVNMRKVKVRSMRGVGLPYDEGAIPLVLGSDQDEKLRGMGISLGLSALNKFQNLVLEIWPKAEILIGLDDGKPMLYVYIN